MKKVITLSALAATISAGMVFATGSLTDSAPLPPGAPAVETNDVVFYGSLEYSEDWFENGGRTRKSGIYSFTVSDFPEFKAVSPVVDETYVTHGGFYANGYYYYLKGDVTASRFTMTFNKMDVKTWEKVESSAHYSPSKTIAYDMTYDYTTSTAYAVGPDFTFTDSGHILNGYALRTIDLDSGEFTDVASLSHNYTALACDANGQLWGIALSQNYPHSGSLYRIDKTNGKETFVGDIGKNQKPQTSTATFDLRTGKLYWSVRSFTQNESYEEFLSDELVEINTQTGIGNAVTYYPGSQFFSSIFMIDNHPDAPDVATNVEFKYKEGSFTEGVASVTLPSRTYCRKSLTGPLTLEILIDGKTVSTVNNLQPGATYTSDNLTAENGSHTLTAICRNSAGLVSHEKSTIFHVGYDRCEGVTDLKVATTKRGDVATISWKAPTKGINGGYIDPSTVTYSIRRRPDNVVIVDGLKSTMYTDTPDRLHGVTQYEVTAHANGVAGKAVNSEIVLAGKAHEIPYLQTFDSNTAFMGFVAIDATSDGSDQGNLWMYYAQYRQAIWWLDYASQRKADDWLITPTLNLSSDKVYRMQFDTQGGFGAGNVTFELCSGPEATVKGMRTHLYTETFPSTNNVRRVNTLFSVADGDCRIGIHALNDGQDHIYLDNIYIQAYGTTAIPQAPVVEKVWKNDDGNVSMTFTLPTKKVNGSDLTSTGTLYVYGDKNRIVAEQPNPVKGSRITVTDTNPIIGVNNYVILLENEDGEGLEGYATIDVVPSAPKPVVNAKVASSGHDAIISWSYPADMLSATGEKLRPQDITYNVYRQVDGSTLALGISETTITDVNADMYLGGKRQGKLQYQIVAVTDGGKALGVLADGIIGQAFDLPFTEDFNTYSAMWSGQNVKAYATTGYDPIVRAGVDDPYFCAFVSSNGFATSPRLNLNSLINPQLTFWIYKTTNTKFNKAAVRVAIEPVDDNGVTLSPIYVPDALFYNNGDEDGWVECKVDLSKYNNYKRASVQFYCSTQGGFPHIDNVTVTGEHAKNDIRISDLTGPTTCLVGRDNVYTATVHNNGLETARDFTLEFFTNGKVTETRTATLPAGESKDFEFIIAPSVNAPEEDEVISVRVTSKEEDYNAFNNTAEMKIKIYLPDLPYITSLKARSSVDNVTLSWDEADAYPHAIDILDDVESYNNFSIDNMGGWKVIDGDGAPTLNGISSSMGNYTWSNCGKPQAFIVFNPERAGVSTLASAYSGSKCFVSFTSACGLNDDWLISPMLLGGKQTISFYARAMHSSYTNEVLEIAVSASGTDIEDFYDSVTRIRVNSTTWRRFQVELPAGTRYFAFHCMSADQFGLMIDNIDYVPAQPPVELWGYNVYRDGERIATEHGENTFVDSDGDYEKPYNYNVTAVYAEGESAISNTVTSRRSGISNVEESVSGVRISPVSGAVEIEGSEGELVTIHNVEGQLYYSFRAKAFERLTLPTGNYIVSAGTTTAKVNIR